MDDLLRAASLLDPAELLARAGVPISKDYKIFVMGDDSFIVLATTPEALARMHEAGYSPKQITPYLQGFVVEKVFSKREAPPPAGTPAEPTVND